MSTHTFPLSREITYYRSRSVFLCFPTRLKINMIADVEQNGISLREFVEGLARITAE